MGWVGGWVTWLGHYTTISFLLTHPPTFPSQTRVVAILHAFTTMTLAYKLAFMCLPLEIGGLNTPGQDVVVNVAGVRTSLVPFLSFSIHSFTQPNHPLGDLRLRDREMRLDAASSTHHPTQPTHLSRVSSSTTLFLG